MSFFHLPVSSLSSLQTGYFPLVPLLQFALSCEIYIFGVCIYAKSLQSCPPLWDTMDHSPPDSSVHGILQARILEWVAMPSSRGFSWPRDWTHVSCIASEFFTHWATWEAQKYLTIVHKLPVCQLGCRLSEWSSQSGFFQEDHYVLMTIEIWLTQKKIS